MARLSGAAIAVAALAVFIASCSSERPSQPGDGEGRFLAGGGRQAGEDAFAGGPADSGPGWPGFDLPDPGFFPLFYADQDCEQNPTQRVITNASDWQAWWTDAIACLDLDGELPPILPLGYGEADGDSGFVIPDTLIPPYPPDAPAVDFAANVVLTIALAPDALPGRSLWIQDVVDDPAGANVHFIVSQLDEDCFGDSPPSWVSSPTLAVLVPRPVTEPITWQREDVTYNCNWEPDPNEPLALYYTDAMCELGAAEMIITDAVTFDAWLTVAQECDELRWYDADSLGVPGETPPSAPPSWLGLQVDFTTHAVLILRSEVQDRWGGGVWLSGFAQGAGGTTIDYTVMSPGADCPLVGNGESVQPTVAIRVPLPLPGPVTWNRATETIACDWDGEDPGSPDSTVAFPPQP